MLTCLSALAACKPYDAELLPPPGTLGGHNGGAGGMDGSVGGGAGGDGSLDEGGTDGCMPTAVEACNRFDDDCDGETDEDTRALCEDTILHAETTCVPYANTARCVLLSCREGFDNCDGDPANGCEPYCVCNPCDDAGSEDAGE
jgi:hypothetical protein